MLINLFKTLKEVGVPCTLRELLDLISGLEKQVIFADINDFYYLSRSVLVKDEKHYDKFDRAFDIYFKGLETLDDVLQALVPEEWLRKEFEKFLTEDELKKIETMGGLMEKIIPRNSNIPVVKEQTFTTNENGQTSIKISVIQGERETSSKNTLLGEFILSDIEPKPAGIPRIKVRFSLDVDGILFVSAIDESSGNCLLYTSPSPRDLH